MDTNYKKRNIFFVGKGGVGKSTCCGCCGLYLTEKNIKTSIFSLDTAHSISSIMEQLILPSGKIKIHQPDFKKLTNDFLAVVSNEIKQRYRYLKVLNLDKLIDFIKKTPGLTEHIITELLFRNIKTKDSKENHDETDEVNLFDMPPTGGFLSLMNYIVSAYHWIEVLLELEKTIEGEEKFKRSFSTDAQPGKSKSNLLLPKLSQLKDKYKTLLQWLTLDSTHFAIIINPDLLSLKQAIQISNELRSLKVKNISLILNKWMRGATSKSVKETIEENELKTLPKFLIEEIKYLKNPLDFSIEETSQKFKQTGELLWKNLQN